MSIPVCVAYPSHGMIRPDRRLRHTVNLSAALKSARRNESERDNGVGKKSMTMKWLFWGKVVCGPKSLQSQTFMVKSSLILSITNEEGCCPARVIQISRPSNQTRLESERVHRKRDSDHGARILPSVNYRTLQKKWHLIKGTSIRYEPI